GGKILIQYKQSSSSDWLDWTPVAGNQVRDFITDVKVGVNYDVRIRSENSLGVRNSSWVTVTGHTILGDSSIPDEPTSVTYIAGNDAAFGRPPTYVGGGIVY